MVLKIWPFDHQLLGRKSASLWVAAVLWLPLGSAERVGRPGLLASESLGWLSNFFHPKYCDMPLNQKKMLLTSN